jgi:hypothetical protein
MLDGRLSPDLAGSLPIEEKGGSSITVLVIRSLTGL